MPSVSPALRLRLVCALLFLGTFLLFGRAVGHEFLDYDDPDFVTENVRVQHGLTREGLRWAFTSGGYAANWQPLTWLSLMLDTQLYGKNPAGFHATSIFWHSLNSVLALLVLRRLTGAFWLSVFGAALFAWHPLRVESVAWISERKDVLSVFFGLLAIWAYMEYTDRRRNSASSPRRFYFLALASFALGLLCKAMLVTLPCVLLLLDVWPLQRGRFFQIGEREPGPNLGCESRDALLLEKIPFLVLSAASGIITYAVQNAGGAVIHTFTWEQRWGNAVVSIGRYLEKFFWPFDLAVCYPYPAHWPRIQVAAALLLIGVLTAVALWQRKSRPWWLIGWVWFLGMLAPVSGLIQAGSQAMADRYTYLPILGLQLAVLRNFRPHARRAWAVLSILVLVGCAARTWNQLGTWENSTTLFEHALAVTDDNYMAHTFRGTTLLNEGRYEEATRHCEKALEINPRYAAAHFTLGVTLEKTGNVDDAVAHYRAALEFRPAFAPVHARLGGVLLHRGQAAEAVHEFELSTLLQSDVAGNYFGWGLALAETQQFDAARAAFAQALRLKPDYAEAHNAVANILVAQRRAPEAWAEYETALRQNPSLAEAHFNYANSLSENDRPGDALLHYRAALSQRSNEADFHYGLGTVLEQLNRADEAAVAYGHALHINPRHAEAQYNLGTILLNRDEPAAAKIHFLTALETRPQFGLAYLGLGLAEEQLGHPSEALRNEERAVALLPRDARAHFFLGQTLRNADRLADAIQQWELSLHLDPTLPSLGEQLAQLRQELALRASQTAAPLP